ncbi:JAB domain-containing protein [Xanthomonas hortorum]|uniref:JAB domain-containing protein n=1 Tax=Xanthomonas hortorum TaxID=56454 RepID=UPI001592C8B9
MGTRAHPVSGNPEPSEAHRQLAKRLQQSLSLLDMRVLDHLVIAARRTSAWRQGGWV